MLRSLLLRTAVAVSALAGCAAEGAASTQHALPGHPTPPAGSRFQITEEAGRELRALWSASSAAKAERVACLGGREEGGRWILDRVSPLEEGRGDSLGVSAAASLDRCGPPEWLGTVHTHIALRDGMRPYANFSGADRGIILMWWRQWRTRGVFCVLYTDRDAHCEVDGVVVAGPGTRAAY